MCQCSKEIISKPVMNPTTAHKEDEESYSHPYIPIHFYIGERKHPYVNMKKPKGTLRGWDNNTRWRCKVGTEHDKCAFHSEEASLQDRKSKIEDMMSSSSTEPIEIVDSELPDIIIDGENVERPINIINCDISSLEVRGNFENDITIHNVNVHNKTVLSDVDLGKNRMRITCSDLRSKMVIKDYFKANRLNVMCSSFRDGIDSTGERGGVDMRCVLYARYCTFKDTVDFEYGNFYDKVSFKHSIFQSDAIFRYTKYEYIASFEYVNFMSTANFKYARFENELWLEQSEFNGIGKFENLYVESGVFKGANMSGCYMKDITLNDANIENVDFRGSYISGSGFNDVRMNRKTLFLGSSDSMQDDNPNNSSVVPFINKRPKCFHDIDFNHYESGRYSEYDVTLSSGFFTNLYNRVKKSDKQEKIENTIDRIGDSEEVYRYLQQIAKENSRNTLYVNSYIRRKEMIRNRHLDSLLDSNKKSIGSAISYVKLSCYRWLMLYGESPWRIIFWSGLISLFYAIIYSLQILNRESQSLLVDTLQILPESLYKSLLIYTNVGVPLSGFNTLKGYIVASESIIGLVMLALFIFVLERRASR